MNQHKMTHSVIMQSLHLEAILSVLSLSIIFLSKGCNCIDLYVTNNQQVNRVNHVFIPMTKKMKGIMTGFNSNRHGKLCSCKYIFSSVFT